MNGIDLAKPHERRSRKHYWPELNNLLFSVYESRICICDSVVIDPVYEDNLSNGYNLAGLMVSQTYPSQRVVTTSYEGAGRVSIVNGQKASEANKTYAL